jgi:hypothetical protein
MDNGYVYDSDGQITAHIDAGDTLTTYYDCCGCVIDPAAPPIEPLPPMEPMQRLFAHTFQFQLVGTELQRQSTCLPPIPASDRIVVTTDRVHTYVTRGGEPAAASNLIGGVEVSTEQHTGKPPQPNRLVCTAQATDFAPGDLVVVRVEVTIWWVICQDGSGS